MKKISFFILMFVGANGSCLSEVVKKEIKESYQFSQLNYNFLKGLTVSVAEIKKNMKEEHNVTSSILKMLENKLNDIQETEKILDEKIVSNSEDHKQSAMNMNNLQNSVDQVNAIVAQNMKHINDLHNQSSSNSMMFMIFESKLDEILNKLERTEQRIDQKFASISEDLQKSALNTDKLQDSLDQLSVNHNETSSIVDQLSASVVEIKKYMKEEHNKTSSILSDIQEAMKMLDQNIVFISEDQQKLGHELHSIKKSLYQFKEETLAEDCSNLYIAGLNVSTSYFLPKYNKTVYCDMDSHGGGWLVIQKRQKVTNQVDFQKDWVSYKEGFGDLYTEFWIGNEFFHRITNQKSYELRIDMEDFEKGTFYATYSEFRVGNEESGYQLHIGGYEGNVLDTLKWHNNMKFTTFDRDNDKWSSGNCAKYCSGGFWYEDCAFVNLNGVFPYIPDRSNDKLIKWYHNSAELVLINVEMKIRPKQ